MTHYPTIPKLDTTNSWLTFALGVACGLGLTSLNNFRKSFDGPAPSDIPTLPSSGWAAQLQSVTLTRDPLDTRRQLTDGGYAAKPENEIAHYVLSDGANKISVYELHPLNQTNWAPTDAERAQKKGTAVISITNSAAGNFQLLSFQARP